MCGDFSRNGVATVAKCDHEIGFVFMILKQMNSRAVEDSHLHGFSIQIRNHKHIGTRREIAQRAGASSAGMVSFSLASTPAVSSKKSSKHFSSPMRLLRPETEHSIS